MSKLREQAAQFITAAGLQVRPQDIQPVTGFWKQQDCYRWELSSRMYDGWGCWLTLTEFVRECKKYGSARLDRKECEIWPAYPEKDVKQDI